MVHASAALPLTLLSLLAACQPSAPPAPVPVRTNGCPRCIPAPPLGALPSNDIDECSGVVAGAAHPDALYVHNDSGDKPRFFAIDHHGAPRGEFDVSGAIADDWEDVARGPCSAGGGSCLFFGDIGDNLLMRDRFVIYRVKEPELLDGARRTVAAEVIPYAYPDEPRNAETLLVHPVTGAITVVTKVKKGSSRVYEVSPSPESGALASVALRGEIAPPGESPRFTGGAVHPEARGVLLRTYQSVAFYPMTPEQTVAEALSGAPCVLPSPKEEQGEAIAWLPGGWDYVTIGEGAGAAIHRVSCEAP